MNKKVLVVASVLAAALALTSCGGKKESKKVDAKSVLHVQVGPSPETIDPALNSAVDGANMILHAFEGLLKFDKDITKLDLLKPHIEGVIRSPFNIWLNHKLNHE